MMKLNEEKFFELMKLGFFEIDSEGRIWRTAVYSKRAESSRAVISINRRRAESLQSKGYLQVRFWVDGKCYGPVAHRLVWLHFFGEIPDGKEINHRYGLKADNRPAELELITHAGNIQHAFRTGLNTNCGENHAQAKLTVAQVEEIRQRYSTEDLTQVALGLEYGVRQATISRVVRHQSWTHTQPVPIELPVSVPMSETIMEVS
jgi:hypothetical protein